MDVLRRCYEKIKALIIGYPKTTIALFGVAGLIIWNFKHGKKTTEVNLSHLIMSLKNNMVESVTVNEKIIEFKTLGTDTRFSTNASILSKDQMYKLFFANPDLKVSCQSNTLIDRIPLSLITPFISMYFLYNLLDGASKGGISEIRRDKKASPVKFADIYGHEQTKKDLQEIIDYLRSPEKFKAIGARIRRGVLLYGPSGTGKTMLAKALSNEAGVNFIYQSATEFLEVYVGVGPKRVRDLFNLARQKAPCIIFLDELDAVGKRFTRTSTKDNYETNATINQLLVEMDGFEESDQIVVIAASNREKFIETALLRSGRFDLKIKVDLPVEEERAGILKKKLEVASHNISEEDIRQFAVQSEGFCGADIDTTVNECILLANRDCVKTCEREHLFAALRKIKANLVQDTTT